MGLKLRELPANEEIFIDANIFLYSAFKHPVLGNNCKIKSFNISILNGSLFPDFIEISKKYWLMATDAFHVATMKRYGITNIATKHFSLKLFCFAKTFTKTAYAIRSGNCR